MYKVASHRHFINGFKGGDNTTMVCRHLIVLILCNFKVVFFKVHMPSPSDVVGENIYVFRLSVRRVRPFVRFCYHDIS